MKGLLRTLAILASLGRELSLRMRRTNRTLTELA